MGSSTPRILEPMGPEIRANDAGRDALGVVGQVGARADAAGTVLGAVHGASGLGEARVAAEAGRRGSGAMPPKHSTSHTTTRLFYHKKAKRTATFT